MIQLRKDEIELRRDKPVMESDHINSPTEAKKFLQKIENEIGLSKVLNAKPSYFKSNFKPETLRKFRLSGGFPPSNR